MKVLTTLTVLGVLALGACAPPTQVNESNVDKTSTQSVAAKSTKNVEISIQFKLKSGHFIMFKF